jgi:hypothetical protein
MDLMIFSARPRLPVEIRIVKCYLLGWINLGVRAHAACPVELVNIRPCFVEMMPPAWPVQSKKITIFFGVAHSPSAPDTRRRRYYQPDELCSSLKRARLSRIGCGSMIKQSRAAAYQIHPIVVGSNSTGMSDKARMDANVQLTPFAI